MVVARAVGAIAQRRRGEHSLQLDAPNLWRRHRRRGAATGAERSDIAAQTFGSPKSALELCLEQIGRGAHLVTLRNGTL